MEKIMDMEEKLMDENEKVITPLGLLEVQNNDNRF
jgi:hypothetical protein